MAGSYTLIMVRGGSTSFLRKPIEDSEKIGGSIKKIVVILKGGHRAENQTPHIILRVNFARRNKMTEKLTVFIENENSVDRSAWTQQDLRAYRHKHTMRGKVLKDYYVKSKGFF